MYFCTLHTWPSHKLSLSPTNYIPLTTPKTWVKFTYYNDMICKLPNLFHNTNLKISFRTNNTNHNTNTHTHSGIYQQKYHTCNLSYTGCPRRNVKYFGRVFLMLNYADITQNTYIQSWTVKELMAIEKCGLLWCPRTVCHPWRNIHPLRKPGKAIASCSDLDERFISR